MEEVYSYADTISYLFRQLPMYQRVGQSAFKKDLTNILYLCNYLGNPEKKFKSIHIAGSNGKGSTTHIIAGALQSQGFKVGVYTSPHYIDFRERIKINGVFIPKKKVVSFVHKMRSEIQEVRPSFFELTVAMCFDFFAEEKVDYAVIETGLGGRLDSTNIIQPMLSVITNISLEHTNILGDTLPEIAAEKAGIIKQKTPVIIGEYQEEVKSVFMAKAKKNDAPIYFAENLVQFDNGKIIVKNRTIADVLELDFGGPFLGKNLITSIAALEILKGLGIDLNWLRFIDYAPRLAKETHFIGRWQWISQVPPILADSAHNVAGIKVVIDEFKMRRWKKIHFVLGFSKDKDLKHVWPMLDEGDAYYFAKANVPRGKDAQDLQLEAAKNGLKGKSYTSVKRALMAAKRKWRNGDLIFVGGSIFIVAEAI